MGPLEGEGFIPVKFINIVSGDAGDRILCTECFDRFSREFIVYNKNDFDKLLRDYPNVSERVIEISKKFVFETGYDLVVVTPNTYIEIQEWYHEDIKRAMAELAKIKMLFK